MCSPQELGLPDQVDGLLILPADAPVGKPFAEYLGRSGGDVVYDLEITPNRPDWNSVIGIAREIAAVTGNKLKIPDVGRGQRPGWPVQAGTPALRLWANLSPSASKTRIFVRVTRRASSKA